MYVGPAKMGNDSFTKYTLAVALHVSSQTESWVNRGWLKATEIATDRGKHVVIQQHNQLLGIPSKSSLRKSFADDPPIIHIYLYLITAIGV